MNFINYFTIAVFKSAPKTLIHANKGIPKRYEKMVPELVEITI